MSFARATFTEPEQEISPVEQVNAPTIDVGESPPEKPILASAPPKASKKNNEMPKLILGGVAAVVLGIATGYGLFMVVPRPQVPTTVVETDASGKLDASIKEGMAFGVPDEKTFKDSATGVLIAGGVNGEGSHTLLRVGGASQNVSLTSSVVELDQFVDMEVTIWGETFNAQRAGWLMDVGRLQVVKTVGQKPDWYKPSPSANQDE